MSSDEIIKLIRDDGWRSIARTAGSHTQFRHPHKKGRVTIPTGVKDLPKGTINSILKQAGLK